ncbi:MAG: three-Cys-motif partner protein TcmP [Thermotogota bacterium]|nr:three-Cys-motif partner protein TcmP [Thermotogota bacterium]
MARDLHNKPFDEGTITKLAIFERYLEKWLPVFLYQPGTKIVNIFDFFCGPGTDREQLKGSPLLAIDIINEYAEHIIKNQTKIKIFFNDRNKEKTENLTEEVSNYPLNKNLAEVKISNESFEENFDSYFNLMTRRDTANFLFIDQSGFKNFPPSIFQKITKLNKTDSLFFIASSFAKRFKDHEQVSRTVPAFKSDEINEISHLHIHRDICKSYKKMVPSGVTYYLAPFSIKKKSNVYGLIFGSGHLRGLNKFLETCWDIDKKSGEANFNIHGDFPESDQFFLSDELNKPKKWRSLKSILKKKY